MLARVLDWAYDDHVVVDLSAVEFMDAAGIGALIKARRLLRASGGDLLVRKPPRMVSRMLALFSLTDLIEQEAEVDMSAAFSGPEHAVPATPPEVAQGPQLPVRFEAQ